MLDLLFERLSRPSPWFAYTVARDVEDTAFDGRRYAYDIDVQTVQAIPVYSEDIREIVVSGVRVYKTNDFETVENLL